MDYLFKLNPAECLETNFNRWYTENCRERREANMYGSNEPILTEAEAEKIFLSQYKNQIAESWFMNKEGRMEQRVVIAGD